MPENGRIHRKTKPTKSSNFTGFNCVMIINEQTYHRRRIATSYLTTIISITLVLFMLGLLGMLILHTQKLSEYIRENIGFSLMIHENVSEDAVIALGKHLDKQPYVKYTTYISRERAAREFEQELGEDFVSFLGYNPLLASLDLRLNASYANPDSMLIVEKKLIRFPEVKEVNYQKSLVEEINRNIRTISLIILGFALILLIIAIALINNTIRLSVYAKRFLIRTMQLVGATGYFIQRPFMWRAIFNGAISGIIADVLLIGILYLVVQEIPETAEFQDIQMLGILLVVIPLLGMLISWISTVFSVRKYIRMRTDSLYQ